MCMNTTLNTTIITLRKLGRPATAKELGVPAPLMTAIKGEGVVKVKAHVKTGKVGRPANLYMLTDKGRKRADRRLKAMA
jgi:predicted ArsR family transcriptional regulator